MATVTFLQLSDVHLGCRFAWLPPDRRQERRREQQRALERAVQLAIERNAAAILLPGDLFDAVEVDAESLALAIHTFGVPGCPPVYIAPGNHDPYSESSGTWSERLLAARDLRWPAHVHRFDTPHWTSLELPGHPVRVWGRCYTPAMASTERPLGPEARGALGTLAPTETHVAVFHGSLEGKLPPGQKMVAPFSVDEARRAPFAWMAIGHYHGAGIDEHFAYAGSPIALGPCETAGHGALVVTLEHGAGPVRASVEQVSLDARRALEVEVDVTGAASADQVDRRILMQLDQARAGAQDLATARLHGRLARGVRWSAPGDELLGRVWHLRVDRSALRPDFDLVELRHCSDETTEGRFARVMLDRLDRETDVEARATIERALYYGLEAFQIRDVTPAWEEIRA